MRLKGKKHDLQTVRKVVIVASTGIKFINGVSNQYNDTFPPEIKGYVNQEKY